MSNCVFIIASLYGTEEKNSMLAISPGFFSDTLNNLVEINMFNLYKEQKDD